MSEKQIVILGGGLAGLITAHEFSKLNDPKSITIIGSQIGPAEELGLHYLHPSRETEKLCIELNLKYEVRPLLGGVITKKGTIVPFAYPLTTAEEALEIVKAHHLKTRGVEWDGTARTMNDFLSHGLERKGPDMVPIPPKVVGEELLHRLQKLGVNMQESGIFGISVEESNVGHNGGPSLPLYKDYTHLVNTIPLRRFVELLKLPDEFVAVAANAHQHMLNRPIYVGEIQDTRVSEDLQNYDFVYSPFGTWWYRMTKKCKDSQFCHEVEFANPVLAKAFDCLNLQKIEYGHVYTDNPEALNSLYNILSKKRIYCVGRFGRWKSGTLVHQVAEEAQTVARWIRDGID